MLLLIADITGNLGHRLTRAAFSRRLSVRGLSQTPTKLDQDILINLESFVHSTSYYDVPAIDRAVEGVDAIICAYSTDPVLYLDGGRLLLRAAERAQVKIFVTPSWTSNWTNTNFGDFEIYNSVIAFAVQAAATSPICPIYLINGAFAEYIFTPGNATFDIDSHGAKYHYWGSANKKKIPWTAMDDAAASAIEILSNGEGILDGRGGVFQFQSGSNTFDELAQIYENGHWNKGRSSL